MTTICCADCQRTAADGVRPQPMAEGAPYYGTLLCSSCAYAIFVTYNAAVRVQVAREQAARPTGQGVG